MPFRFAHTADLHLDSPLRSMALRDPGLAALIATATRTALSRIVDLCLAERLDALLIAGDLYDGGQTSMKTARFLAEQLGRLDAGGVRCFVIRGNHDAVSEITRELVLPAGVTVFGARPHVEEIAPPAGPRIAVQGVSFAQRHAKDSLLPLYRPMEGALNIGLMHTSLDGAPGHDRYAPCASAALMASGFAYWALGHIHVRAVQQGAAAVVMPGMPQGRDMGEAGARSLTLVSVGDDGALTLEERRVAMAEFARVTVDAGGVEDRRMLAGRIEQALGAARDAAGADHLVARVRFSGATPLGWALRRDADVWRAEVEARAGAIADVWIEAVDSDATPPAAAGTQAEGFDALRAMVEQGLAAGAYAEPARALAQAIRGQVPPECRAMLGEDEAAAEATLAALTREGVAEALAHLRPAEEG